MHQDGECFSSAMRQYAGIGFHSSGGSEEMVHNRKWADGCDMQITRIALMLNTDCADVTTPSSVVVLVLIKLDRSILLCGTDILPVETQCENSEGHYPPGSECLAYIQMAQTQMGAYVMFFHFPCVQFLVGKKSNLNTLI